MNYNTGMYQNYTVEGSAEVNITNNDKKEKMTSNYCETPLPGVVCPTVMECPVERCIHREIIHEVPHVQPINTKIINHHIYKHTYRPCYTCTEENEVCNVNECCNNKFML